MKKIIILFLLIFGLFSCATKKQIRYLQDIETLNNKTIEQKFEPIIEINDILYISVSSRTVEVIEPFRRVPPSTTNNVTNSNPGLQGYLVNAEGNIRFPVLGDVMVAGKTRMEIENILQSQIKDYVLDVVVDVRIMNFNITVIGEVNKPGLYNIRDERVSLPEALALAGDLTEDGKRSEIVVVREKDGVRKVERIDFTDASFYDSEFYFLKQNDLVYVEPSLKGVRKSGFLPDVPALISLFSVILSTVIILTL